MLALLFITCAICVAAAAAGSQDGNGCTAARGLDLSRWPVASRSPSSSSR